MPEPEVATRYAFFNGDDLVVVIEGSRFDIPTVQIIALVDALRKAL